MSRQSLSLPMSQIIASDAPLLSPVLTAADSPWDHQAPSNPDVYAYSYYNLPSPPASIGSTSTDSPRSTSGMLKARMSPDSTSEGEQLCVPTHQVFDIPAESIPPSPLSSSPPSPQLPRLSISINPHLACAKRTASPAVSTTKKPRASGDRVTSKEFIPPDVSGLSKREARLVKNRAAAFLSRQRKREEFELMEIRVAELEEENSRLLALSQSGNLISRPKTQPEEKLLTEIEQLRAQLAAAEERERELKAKLERTTTTRNAAVKIESVEPELPSKPISVSSPSKSGAGFGLMVLLCALPTLLSMRAHSSLPTTFSLPFSGSSMLPVSSSSFGFNSFTPNEYDWSRNPGAGSMMDLDMDDKGRVTASLSTNSNPQKLEFAESGELDGLSALDISFDASRSENGRIRVRIHPSSSTSTRSSSPEYTGNDDTLSMWGSDSGNSFGDSFAPSDMFSTASASASGDPFIGAPASDSDYGLGAYAASSSSQPMSIFEQEGSSLSHLHSFGSEIGKRRVRIALKSMPTAGSEGGEWEVQLC